MAVQLRKRGAFVELNAAVRSDWIVVDECWRVNFDLDDGSTPGKIRFAAPGKLMGRILGWDGSNQTRNVVSGRGSWKIEYILF